MRSVLFIIIGFIFVSQSTHANPVYPPFEPIYEVREERRHLLKMSDGTRLSTDLYFPITDQKKLPIILMRTPYNKLSAHTIRDARIFAAQGYIVATQDKRGKFESEGYFEVIGGEDIQDGYTTIDWLSKQEWSNGKIGTYGCSYLGEIQILQAPLKHPALQAMIPQAAGSAFGKAYGRYRFMSAFNGGAVELAAGLGWLYSAGNKLYLRPPAHLSDTDYLKHIDKFDIAPKLKGIDVQTQAWTLPWKDALENTDAPPTDFPEKLMIPLDSDFWETTGLLDGNETIDVPALHVNSWYDYGMAETMLTFNLFRENALSEKSRNGQYAIIAPGTHCQEEEATENTIVGKMPVGAARYPFWQYYLAWFDYWLKDKQDRLKDIPKIQYYIIGRNQWFEAENWPIEGTTFTKYYLNSSKGANSVYGDGSLTVEPSASDKKFDEFTYDPATPVPTIGGSVCCTSGDVPPGAYDQRPNATRQDVLVYSTPPLEEAVDVVGPIKAVFYVSSSAPDTDFTAKLIDVHPDGTAYNIQEGIFRVRYRNDFEKPEMMQAGEIYKIEIDMQASGAQFAKGHQISLHVTSSNFPRFDRNLNTGEENASETEIIVAQNKVHHSAEHPSHVLLPILPADKLKPVNVEKIKHHFTKVLTAKKGGS